MMLLDGKALAKQIRDEIRKDLKGSVRPGLAFVLIGDHAASQSYVKMKAQACEEVGFHSQVLRLPEQVPEKQLLALLEKLNCDRAIHGILVQQPLPNHIQTDRVVETILPSKDVDGFHPLNLGLLMQGADSGFIPCTPLGVVVLLERYGIDLAGQHVVVLGRSNIVGKPLASLLGQKRCNATVTLAHSQTHHLAELSREADVLISAIGVPHFVTKQMVKQGAVVVDVGINHSLGKLVGDVDFNQVQPIAAAITPVPGGVGPMTIAMLLQNTYTSFLRCHG